MAEKLSESKVRQLAGVKPLPTRTVWADEPRGLGLRMFAPSAKQLGGTISWVLAYRTHEGTKRLATLGRWPTVSLGEARKAAKDLLAQARSGGDPVAERRTARTSGETVGELIERYVGDPTLGWKASTRTDIERTLRNHVAPVLGKLELTKLTPADLRRLQVAVVKGDTVADRKGGKRSRSIVKGGTGASHKVLRYLAACLRAYPETKLATMAALADLSIPQSRTRTRIYSDKEIAAISEALEWLDRERPRLAVQTAALRLVLVTGARKQEILGLRWGDFDRDGLCLRLGETKTGQKLVPLPPAVAAWLGRLPRRHDEFVFPARGGKVALRDVRPAWDAVRERAKLGGEGLDAAVIHTFRHTAATAAIEADLSGPVIMAMMGYRTADMLSRYGHVSAGTAAVRRRTAQLASGKIKALGMAADVVPMPSRKGG